MLENFRSVTAALCNMLKLREPDFGAEEELILIFDGLEIALGDSPDGNHLVISGRAGFLAVDWSRRVEQVRSVLKTNLAFLTSNQACAYAEIQGDGTAAIRVRAIYPYRLRSIPVLATRIEDVLLLMEVHGSDLAGPGRSVPTRVPRDEMLAGSFVFRV